MTGKAWRHDKSPLAAVDPPIVANGSGDAGAFPQSFTIPESGLSLESQPEGQLPEHIDSAWSLCCDGFEQFSPDSLRTLNDSLIDNPELRESAMLAAIIRAKAVLSGVDADGPPDAECVVSAADLMLLLQTAKRRLR